MSLRVTSSGYMPPVSSKSARRSSGLADPRKRFATPGSHHTGSTAILVTAPSRPPAAGVAVGTCRRWKASAWRISGRWMCAW